VILVLRACVDGDFLLFVILFLVQYAVTEAASELSMSLNKLNIQVKKLINFLKSLFLLTDILEARFQLLN